ncbi:sporulation protein [Pyrococcus furiosus DSM 3638]|uniref:Sporulation protein n=2 Tax=Pyrococcus furiosus TaxID=2261 RepID=Q8U0F6_PYRFU|nr:MULTISPECIES: stage II sporulation protein M [Pyrococcus]AAL81757.1 hypothetical protein PF1633 [Pyrococcus furiosus DSM 3638]AFN05007.1 hypothetical protein PFC_10440 [Pyrococcus furiosus COM1]MDK2869451.1 stage sporulation protein [Pyrococcus sp.]QEK79255.1 sporulation protein [Pyrococcus furiosus DSM 3638]
MNVKKVFVILISVFLFGTFVGALIGYYNPKVSEEAVRGIKEILGGGNNFLLNSPFKMFVFIFLNNTRVAILSALLGIAFGIVPLLIMFFNGLVVGVVVVHVSRSLPITKVLLSIVPHGIIEIPALALAGTAGILWFSEILHGKGSFGARVQIGFKKMLRILGISIVLLLIAAFIEAFITPKLAGL